MKVELPYLNRITAKGREYWYYRRNGENVPLGAAPGEPGFTERYETLHAQFEAGGTAEKKPGSLGALIVLYKTTSPEYKAAGRLHQAGL
jgi:hypothetical protein